MAYKHDAEHDVAKRRHNFDGSLCQYGEFFSKNMFQSNIWDYDSYIEINNNYLCHYKLWSWVFISLSGFYFQRNPRKIRSYFPFSNFQLNFVGKGQ